MTVVGRQGTAMYLLAKKARSKKASIRRVRARPEAGEGRLDGGTCPGIVGKLAVVILFHSST